MDYLDTDEYIAGLLARDAKTRTSLYTYNGTGAKPKPNTRFLRNIVREADNHNAALLAKESAEAKLRLRRLQGKPDDIDSSRRYNRSRSRTRRRSRSVERQEDRERHRNCHRRHRHHREKKSRHRSYTRSRTRSRSRSRSRSQSRSRSPSRYSKRPRRRDLYERGSNRKRRRCSESTSRSRSRSPSRSRHRRSRRHRSRSPQHSSRRRHRRSPSPKKPSAKDDEKPSVKHARNKKERKPSVSPAFSDPLSEIIGPAFLPVQPSNSPPARGRGGTGQAAMDSRFFVDYNPANDIQLSDHNEFDDALEAYRDQQKWKQQGAERLRSAGMTEEFISAWENNATKRESDLKWTKKGCIREWDRGKVLEGDEEGDKWIDLRANWIKK